MNTARTVEAVKSVSSTMHALAELQLRFLGLKTRDERGAVSTEMAVVISAMVIVAIAVGVIILAKARANAENIPTDAVNLGG